MIFPPPCLGVVARAGTRLGRGIVVPVDLVHDPRTEEGSDGTFYRRACNGRMTAREIKRDGETYLGKFQVAPRARGQGVA